MELINAFMLKVYGHIIVICPTCKGTGRAVLPNLRGGPAGSMNCGLCQGNGKCYMREGGG